MKDFGLNLERKFFNKMNTEKNKIFKNINNKLFILEDFLFPETCNFLIKEFSKDLKDSRRFEVFSGPNGDENKNRKVISW